MRTITIAAAGRATDVSLPDDVGAWLVAQGIAAASTQADAIALGTLAQNIAKLALGASTVMVTIYTGGRETDLRLPSVAAAWLVARGIAFAQTQPENLALQQLGLTPPPIPALTLTGPLTFATNATSGTLVANIGNVPTGATPTITPGDGRLVIAGDATNGWKVVTGLTASSAGTIALAVSAVGANDATASVVVTAVASASVPAAFTVTQLAAAQGVRQRSTLTGGGQGFGQAIVPHVMSVTGAGEIWARRRSFSDGTTIVQAPWRVTANASVGNAQTINVAGVDAPALSSDGMTAVVANDGVFTIDFAGDSAFTVNVVQGTTPILIGDVTAKFTQSQGGYSVGRMSTDATTLSAMSQPITPFGRVFATTASLAHAVAMPSVGSIVWDTVRDAGPYNSAGVAEELRLKAALTGVAQGYVSYSVGGTKLATWQSGQANMTQFRAVLNAAFGGSANTPGGGWRFQESYVGGTDAAALGVTASSMQSALAGAWDAPANLNFFALNGGTLIGTVCACPAINSAGNTGDHTQLAAVRDGERLFAASRSFGYSQAQGLALSADSTHQLQAGSQAQARDEVRSLRPQLGLSGNNVGATVVSSSRVGNVITLAMSAPITVTGNPTWQFLVLDQGNALRRRMVQTVAASGSNLTITLYADPGAGAVLEVYAGMNQLSVNFSLAGTAVVAATGLNSGEAALGLTKGAEIGYSISNTPIATVPAVTNGGTVNAIPAFNLTAAGTPTYAAGATGFGNELTGGYASTTVAAIVESVPRPKTSTFCFLASLSATPSGAFTIIAADPTGGNNAAGFSNAGLFYYNTVAIGTTDWRNASRVWFSIEDNGTTVSVYADTGAGPVLVGSSAAVGSMGRFMYGGMGLRATVGGIFSDALAKTVDSVALFNGVQTAYRTRPSASLTGTEANLIALYNAESSVVDSATTLK